MVVRRGEPCLLPTLAILTGSLGCIFKEGPGMWQVGLSDGRFGVVVNRYPTKIGLNKVK